jgi:hypothetical protein
VAKRKTSKSDANHFTAPMQTEALHLVNVSAFSKKAAGLRNANVGGKFDFRQGLWIEDLRIPPGQECSNGSLILLAVALWRTFCDGARPPGRAVNG